MLLRACLFCFLTVCPLANATDNPQKTLKLFIWENYFPDELITKFKKQHGIQVEQIYYETDELKDETLIQTNGGQGMDLIVGSRASFVNYKKLGWLSPYKKDDLPNLKHIDTHWLPDGDLKSYSIPYLWGTVGIAFRKDKVSTPIKEWKDIFQPNATLNQKIMMINDSRDTLGLALKALGYSINSTNSDELATAEKLLLKQKPFVKTYSYPSLDKNAAIVKGDIWVSLIYNGDALFLNELNPNIDFVVPEDGTNLWVDDIAVFKSSNNKEYAWKFINFIHEPEHAAAIAKHLYYATPNKTAHQYLDKAFLEDKRIYPSAETIARSEFFKELSPKQLKQRNDIFLKVVK